MQRKHFDSILLILGLFIIVGSFIGYFFYALSFKVMVWIILLDLALLLALLYFRNYKNHHYGGKFNDHFPDAH
ncbi:putative uncharacterized protein [Firmicutes bacterium CAG:536]|jgi:amino acid transporter|nr:hypothetical protein DW895_02390 [Firmicutes bacterium AM41-11]CDA33831.1 putative uncharacterized protein [Firmicutes bacterium CAG:536]CRH85677.1 Uncharacterised protein [Chlamydia trachomatis]